MVEPVQSLCTTRRPEKEAQWRSVPGEFSGIGYGRQGLSCPLYRQPELGIPLPQNHAGWILNPYFTTEETAV